MKCLKNTKTGNIVRVSDVQAYQMVGNTWQYVSKTDWKKSNGMIKEEAVVTHDMGGSIETKVEKKKNSKKVS